MKNLSKTLLIALSLILMSCGSKTTDEEQRVQIETLQRSLATANISEVIAALPEGCFGKSVETAPGAIIVKCSDGGTFFIGDEGLNIAAFEGGFNGEHIDYFDFLDFPSVEIFPLVDTRQACDGPHNILTFDMYEGFIEVIELNPDSINTEFHPGHNDQDLAALGLTCDPFAEQLPFRPEGEF